MRSQPSPEAHSSLDRDNYDLRHVTANVVAVVPLANAMLMPLMVCFAKAWAEPIVILLGVLMDAAVGSAVLRPHVNKLPPIVLMACAVPWNALTALVRGVVPMRLNAIGSLQVVRLALLKRFFADMQKWEQSPEIAIAPYSRVLFIFVNLAYLVVLLMWIGAIWWAWGEVYGFGSEKDWGPTEAMSKKPLVDCCLAALYWAYRTVLLGEMKGEAKSRGEVLASMLFSFVGVILLATFIGIIGSLITDLNLIDRMKREKLKTMQGYMDYIKMPKDFQLEVMQHIANQWEHGHGLNAGGFLSQLTVSLKHRVAMHMHEGFTSKVPFLQVRSRLHHAINRVTYSIQHSS